MYLRDTERQSVVRPVYCHALEVCMEACECTLFLCIADYFKGRHCHGSRLACCLIIASKLLFFRHKTAMWGCLLDKVITLLSSDGSNR